MTNRRSRTAQARRLAEHDDAVRRAAKLDEMTMSFVSRMQEAQIEAALAANTLIGSQDRLAISDLFERVLHGGIQEAVGKLPQWPIDRCEFDALPIVQEDDPSHVGRSRMQLRSWWILIHANANGMAHFFRPEMMDGEREPLN